jgi:HD-GYP domain-containing protein (c-di-GMP phosphodiesterase class II)
MCAKPTAAGPIAVHGRTSRILDSSARILRAQIELRGGPGARVAAGREPAACRTCAEHDDVLRSECLRLRDSRAATAALHGRLLEWSCPHGVELSVHPVAGRAGSGGNSTLLCVGPGPRPGATSPPSAAAGTPGAETFRLRLRADHGPGRGGRRAFLRDLSRLLGDESVMAAELAERSAELTTRCDELRMFYAVAGSLAVPHDLRTALRNTIEFARLAQDADAAVLVVPSRRFHEVRVRAGLEDEAGPGRRRAWTALQRALEAPLAAGDGLFVGAPWDSIGASPFQRPAEVLAVALQRNGGGFLALLHFDGRHSFRTSDAKLVESLAEQIRLATANAELYEDLRLFLMATVKSLVGAIEAKDSYTSGHSERVNLLSMLIGRELDLSPQDQETLRWASILHDVGKIGMPEGILQKPGRLTPEEFQVIKEHPDRGHRLLLPIGQLAQAAAIVRAHHETVDGKGYPLGLKGEEIPLLARIIAVADTFDALTSTRPYRTARPLDHALAEIRRVRGTQLDGSVVDGFLKLVPFLREHRVMIQAVSFPEREAAA